MYTICHVRGWYRKIQRMPRGMWLIQHPQGGGCQYPLNPVLQSIILHYYHRSGYCGINGMTKSAIAIIQRTPSLYVCTCYDLGACFSSDPTRLLDPVLLLLSRQNGRLPVGDPCAAMFKDTVDYDKNNIVARIAF